MNPRDHGVSQKRFGPARVASFMRVWLATLALFGAATAVAQDATTHPAAGTWEGAIEIPGSPLGVVVTLAHDGSAWVGAIDIPAQGAAGIPLDTFEFADGVASFKIAGVPGDPTFRGAVDGDTLTGTFTQGGQEFPFALTRVTGGADTGSNGEPVTEYGDPAGRYTVPVPTGWTVSEEAGYVRVAGPDGGVHVDVVVSGDDDLEAAIADAWLLAMPGVVLTAVQTLEPPSAPGVDRTVLVNYASGPNDEVYQALAQSAGGETYVLLVYGELEMVQRRSAQLQIVAGGFEITGTDSADLTGIEPRAVSEVIGEFEAFVASTMEDYGVPGASIAVVEDGSVAYLEGFGVKEAGGVEPMTPATHVMIGSTGKTMTSMLIATLVDDGVVDWDTPVIEVLPRFAVADEALTQSITFRNLLCACTGVPRRDLEFLFSYEELSAEGVVESLRQFEFFTEFGEAFQYSNQLVATAGYAAAAAAGAPYGQLSQGYRAALDDRVLEPIGMHDTTLDFAEVVARGDFATPHQLEIASGEYEPIDVSLEALLTPVEPAGAHWSTAQDMAQYLITELNRGVNPAGGRVVSEENLFVTWQPQVPVSATESYGLGWMVGAYYGLPWIYHGGNTLGFTSEFVFLPEAGVGIAVFANAQGANAFTAVVAARLLELIYDQPSTVIAQSEFQVEQMARMVEEQAGSILDRVPLDEALTYFGAYDNAALGTVSLRLEGGQLLLDAGEWSTQLRPVVGLDGEPEGYVTYGAPITGLSVSLDTGGDGTPRMVVGDGLVQYEFERVR